MKYEIDLDIPIANAQALGDPICRRVRLFGGLIRHRSLTSAALTFVVAHETGHHLGGEPRHPVLHWLSSEERATQWAVDVGLPKILGHSEANRIATLGKRDLELLYRA